MKRIIVFRESSIPGSAIVNVATRDDDAEMLEVVWKIHQKDAFMGVTFRPPFAAIPGCFEDKRAIIFNPITEEWWYGIPGELMINMESLTEKAREEMFKSMGLYPF